MPKKNLIRCKDLKKTIVNRFNILIGFVILLFTLTFIGLISLQIFNHKLYQEKLVQATQKIIESNSVPRGRIYDRNYNLLVDNVGKKIIYYQKQRGIKSAEEIALAYKMADILDVPYSKLYEINLKEFWLLNHREEAKAKITDEEYKLFKQRKLTSSELQKLKLERVTADELSLYNDRDKKAAYIYYLMNKGYAYDEKIIKDTDVTDKEYAYISENINNYNGFNTKLEWERKYIYGDVLKGVLGNISNNNQGIPYELKADYLAKGYSLNDRVGLSNLEYQYEDVLKGDKSLYKITNDNSLELLKNGIRGNDIVLSIDINLQLQVEDIMKEEMIKAKEQPNTDYYNKSFVLITNPNNGEILVYAAKQIIKKDGQYEFYDYTPYVATSSITVGSVIKGASMTVGYKTKAIDIGTKMLDECIKLKNTPEKCSFKSGLGVLDDVGALRWSSNSYQFKIAMKVSGVNYQYNMPFVINNNAYDIYRSTFAEFGLGVKTGVDLPLEGTGLKGGSSVAGHLLDFAIGQYDTYTPLQLSQYINTIANGGNRIQLHFLKEVHEKTTSNDIGKLKYVFEPKVYNKVDIEDKYLNRVRYAFSEVIRNGLGVGYMGNVPSPAGKTGTAQSFVDSDNNGVIDKETLTNTFAGFYPLDNPTMSIVVISPDIYNAYHNSTYRTMVNKRLATKITQKFFDIYK